MSFRPWTGQGQDPMTMQGPQPSWQQRGFGMGGIPQSPMAGMNSMAGGMARGPYGGSMMGGQQFPQMQDPGFTLPPGTNPFGGPQGWSTQQMQAPPVVDKGPLPVQSAEPNPQGDPGYGDWGGARAFAASRNAGLENAPIFPGQQAPAPAPKTAPAPNRGGWTRMSPGMYRNAQGQTVRSQMRPSEGMAQAMQSPSQRITSDLGQKLPAPPPPFSKGGGYNSVGAAKGAPKRAGGAKGQKGTTSSVIKAR